MDRRFTKLLKANLEISIKRKRSGSKQQNWQIFFQHYSVFGENSIFERVKANPASWIMAVGGKQPCRWTGDILRMLFREYPGGRRKEGWKSPDFAHRHRIKEGRITEDGQRPVSKNDAFWKRSQECYVSGEFYVSASWKHNILGKGRLHLNMTFLATAPRALLPKMLRF